MNNNGNPHIIQKAVIDITLPNVTAIVEWETNERLRFTSILKSELEKCFDMFDYPGSLLVIQKLNIDLGVLNLNSQQTNMQERLYAELQKNLKDHLNAAVKTGNHYPDKLTPTDSAEINSADHFFNEQEGKLKALCFYLDKGYLPWWGSVLADWNEAWLEELPGNVINRFKEYLTQNDDRNIQRMAQFSDGFLARLLQRFEITVDTLQPLTWLKQITNKLLEQQGEIFELATDIIKDRIISYPVVRSRYWFGWIAHAIGRTTVPGLGVVLKHEQVIQLIARIISEKDDILFTNEVPGIWKEEIASIRSKRTYAASQSRASIISEKDDILFTNEVPGIWKEEIAAIRSKRTNAASSLQTKNLTKDNEVLAKEISQKEKLAKDIEILSQYNKANDSKGFKREEKEATDALLVNNAGLILLHPFLIQLFRHCALVDKNRFTDEYSQTTAVYALHYLATGNVKAMEHELVFPKFLAGMDWEQPLMPVEPLNDEQKAACNELLTEVLNHWESLGNTSPDGLREGFLQRTGKLEHIYSGWQLILEQKTLDILLSRLPWGISVVKFPWMKNMLTITW